MNVGTGFRTPQAVSFALLALAAAVFFTCKFPNEPVKGNTFPETRLANVPVDDTVALYINLNAFPEITLNWLGDDPDGYIIAYRYRWTDYIRGVAVNQTPWTTVLNISRPGWQNVIGVKGSPGSLFRIYNYLVTLAPTDTAIINRIADSLTTMRPFAVPYKTGVIPTDSIVGMDPLQLLSPTRGTFIFFSPVDSNQHRFEVSSIDNNDAIDPSPARVNFWTLISPGSVAVIDAIPPANSLTTLVPTERFPGLRFAFRSLDPNNTTDLYFSWAVDDTTRWSQWTQDGFAYVTGRDFNPVASGRHRFYVRARNRWGVISLPAETSFTAIIPDFVLPNYQPRILLVNATPPPGVLARGLDTNAVRAFYSEVMDSIGKAGKYDFLHLAPAPLTRFPTDTVLGKYSLVIYMLETNLPVLGAAAQYRLQAGNQTLFARYLDVGGNLIISGVPDPQRGIANFTQVNSFAHTYLHIQPPQGPLAFYQNNLRDFVGAKGFFGHPNVPVDPTRLPPDSTGGLWQIALSFGTGFADNPYTFDSGRDSLGFENLPVSVRFQAPETPPPGEPRTYSTFYFGFPLYYCQKSAVIEAMRKAVSDVYH